MMATKTPLFRLGQIVATPGALEALETCGQSPSEFLNRHIVGDWGVLSADDRQSNDEAVIDGSRILSAYYLSDHKTKIWVITEATDDSGNRAATTLLLPDEY